MAKIKIYNTTSELELNENEFNYLNKYYKIQIPSARYLYSYKLWKKTKGAQGWDGTVSLVQHNKPILTGLIPEVLEILKQRGVQPILMDFRGLPAQPTLGSTTVRLRDYQYETIKAAFSNEIDKLGWWPRGVLQLPTGSGKTQIAVAMFQMYPVNTMFLVHRKDLLIQAKERFNNYGVQVGLLGSGKWEVDDRINIATVQTLNSALNFPDRAEELIDLVPKVKQVFFDECFHPSHKLLTPYGWKFINEINENDLVAQISSDTRILSFIKPLKLIKRQFKGNLINFKNQKVDLLATPNHEHLIYKGRTVEKAIKNKPIKICFKDLKLSNYLYHIQTIHILGNENITFWERFLIAYQADGCYLRQSIKSKEYCIRFSFKKEKKIQRLIYILRNLKQIKWNVSKNKRGDTNIVIWLKEKPYRNLNWISLTKSSSYYKNLLNEIVEWDGYKQTNNRFEYDSVLKENAEKVHTIAKLAGFYSSLNFYYGKRYKNKKIYRVLWSNAKSLMYTRCLQKKQIPYEGMVYCVEVPNGNLLTKRNEKISVTGNCHTYASNVKNANEFIKVAGLFNNTYCRWGLTATPFMREKYDNMLLKGVTGEVLYKISNKELIDQGYLSNPKVKILRVKGGVYIPKGNPRDMYRAAYEKGIMYHQERNRLIAEEIKKGPHPCLCLVTKIEHANNLKLYCEDDVIILTGKTPLDVRQKALNKFRNCELKSIIATTVFDEGIDVPQLRKVILAGGGKSVVKQLQRSGRGLRTTIDKHEVEVVDFLDEHHFFLKNHSLSRMKIWITENFKTEIIN